MPVGSSDSVGAPSTVGELIVGLDEDGGKTSPTDCPLLPSEELAPAYCEGTAVIVSLDEVVFDRVAATPGAKAVAA